MEKNTRKHGRPAGMSVNFESFEDWVVSESWVASIFSSPGVYAWVPDAIDRKSPINGASLLTSNANPAVNGWAREI
ncbi:MAG TPA: hypothetical protein VE961_19420 [Pyrinomonadaceae bacterium]|nr:hypothetical protein [Pyrinomonadaceae bacterium]